MKLHYGISISTAAQLAELPELKKAAFLELPFSLCGQPDFILPKNWKNRLHRISGRSQGRTLNSLIDAGSSMSREFYRFFAKICAVAAASKAREISLAVDWENALENTGYAAKLRTILRCCYGIAQKNELTPVIELRIPGTAVNRDMDFIRLRDSWMIPVRTLIDLHPHEPGSLEMLETFFASHHFDCNKFRISFDASGGNYLTGKLLDRVKNCIRPVGAEMTEICFYPGRNADRDCYQALQAVIS